MLALFVGLLVGILMCIPIGPINVWVISVQMRENTTHALAIALGGSLMDFVYFYFILNGLRLVHFSSKVEFYLQVLGASVILFWGVKEAFFKAEIVVQGPGGIRKRKALGYLAFGAFIYASNPTLIVTMTALAAFIKSMGLFSFSHQNIIFLSLGLSIGSFCWFVFLTKFVECYREKIQTKYFHLFSLVSGYLMMGLSVLLFFKIFSKGDLI